MHSGTIIHMRNVPGNGAMRALDQFLLIKNMYGEKELIPVDFTWDGSSVPWVFQGLFPRHNHPVASVKHDHRVRHAKNKEERLWADKEFKKDVRTTSWWVTAQVGYIGVRIGSFFGIGNRY